MTKYQEAIVSTAWTWAVGLACLGLLVACGKKAENQVAVASPATAVVESGPTLDQKVDAMLRGHPNSKRVCVDGVRKDAFFLDYGPHLPAGTPNDNKWHGIMLIVNIEFYKTSNDTWFITEQATNRYFLVYPELDGLVCKANP